MEFSDMFTVGGVLYKPLALFQACFKISLLASATTKISYQVAFMSKQQRWIRSSRWSFFASNNVDCTPVLGTAGFRKFFLPVLHHLFHTLGFSFSPARKATGTREKNYCHVTCLVTSDQFSIWIARANLFVQRYKQQDTLRWSPCSQNHPKHMIYCLVQTDVYAIFKIKLFSRKCEPWTWSRYLLVDAKLINNACFIAQPTAA